MTFERDLKEGYERKRKLAEKLERGSDLLESRNYEEALENFLWVYDNQDGYTIGLTSYYLKRLAKKYPPSIPALRQRRDHLEKLVLDGRADSSVVSAWVELNGLVKEKERTLEVYYKLKATGASEDIIKDVLSDIWEKLLKEKQYSDLESYLSSMTNHILHRFCDYDALNMFPDEDLDEDEIREDKSMYRDWIAKDAPRVFEAALALNRADVADLLYRRVIALEPSDRVFARLIKRAARVQDLARAASIYETACKTLPEGERKKVEKVVGNLPEGWRNRP